MFSSIIPCSVCSKPLFSPIISLTPCHHIIHGGCFSKIASPKLAFCFKCGSKFTQGIRNKEVEKTIVKLEQIVSQTLRGEDQELVYQKLLHNAIKEDDIALIDVLIAKGISVTDLFEGVSPLYVACIYVRREIAQRFLEAGASPSQKNKIRLCDRDEYWIVSDSLLEKTQDDSPMNIALRSKDEALFGLLFPYDKTFDQWRPNGRTPLHEALYSLDE
jgi:hypothetical protein